MQGFYSSKVLDRQFMIEVNSATTVWQFKDQVARIIGLGPNYLKLTLADQSSVLDCMNGTILQDINIKSGDIITAERRSVADYAEKANLINT